MCVFVCMFSLPFPSKKAEKVKSFKKRVFSILFLVKQKNRKGQKLQKTLFFSLSPRQKVVERPKVSKNVNFFHSSTRQKKRREGQKFQNFHSSSPSKKTEKAKSCKKLCFFHSPLVRKWWEDKRFHKTCVFSLLFPSKKKTNRKVQKLQKTLLFSLSPRQKVVERLKVSKNVLQK